MKNAMRICVLSDTHGNTGAVDSVLEVCGDVDFFIHLGDIAADAEYIFAVTDKTVHSVYGNCDFMHNDDTEYEVVTAGNVRILITHGHRHAVDYYGSRLICESAKKEGCAVAMYGHTHIPLVDMVNNIWIVNPGSPSRPRGGYKPSYAILTIEQNGRIVPTIYNI